MALRQWWAGLLDHRDMTVEVVARELQSQTSTLP